MPVVYKYTNKINNKSYVGFAKNLDARHSWHKRSANKGVVSKFYNAIRKYGLDNFTLEILEESVDRDFLLNQREGFWIAHFDTLKNGYNMTRGGEGGPGGAWSGKKRPSHAQKMKGNNFTDNRNNVYQKKFAKSYKVTYNNGKSETIHNLNKFCRENPKYNLGGMYSAYTKGYKHHDIVKMELL